MSRILVLTPPLTEILSMSEVHREMKWKWKFKERYGDELHFAWYKNKEDDIKVESKRIIATAGREMDSK